MIHISRVSLRNFKSFRRVSIPIPKGFTAIVGPNGSGKCVHGDTRVLLADGRMERIEDLVERALSSSTRVEKLEDGIASLENPFNVVILSLNPQTLKVEAKGVTAFIKRKAPEHLIRIKTRAGREILTTHYHPVFSFEEGRIIQLRADELKVGRRIALPRRLRGNWDGTSLETRMILSRFIKEDNVYVPYSDKLRDHLRALEKKFGGRKNLASAAGVSSTVIKSVHDGQAINAANLYRIFEAAGHNGYRVSELKSKGHGWIRVPESIDDGLGRFLGYLIAEGRNNPLNQIWFVNEDPEIKEDFLGLAREFFGVEAKQFSWKGKTVDRRIFSHALCLFLDRIFGVSVGRVSSESMVPEILFTTPDEVVQEFLSGLFAGDAYFCLRRGKKITAYMEYSTASRKLAEDVSTLLLRFGIPSTIKEKTTCALDTGERTERSYYSVFVYGLMNLKKLAERLRVPGSKGRKLEEIKRLNYKSNPPIDLIPGVNPLVKKAVRAAGINIEKTRIVCPELAAYYENRCLASREGLLEVIRTIERNGKNNPEVSRLLRRLHLVATSDVYWDEIMELEKVDPPKWVYDLTVEGNHNFIANGVFVHNSNIVDAICFVLGRSSAKSLRAERFSDLIFNGGKKEKPAKVAEVSLYLDNAGRELPVEEREVKISRSVDVEGNSVYRLNGRRSSRAEILDLLAHAKIQPDGHNIVLQGDVTRIVEMSPIERRELIDEIAGIAEYDERKRKALRELEKVSDNISKVEAVVGEVGSSLSKLSKEREDALRHGELKAEVRRCKGMMLYSHRLEAEANIREMEATLSKAEDELNRIERFLDVLALKYEVKKQELEGVNIEIAAREEADRFQAFRDLERARNELAAWNTKEKELEEKLAGVECDYEEAKKEIVEVHGEIKRCRDEKVVLRQEIEGLEAKIIELRKRVEETYKRASSGLDEASGVRDKLRAVLEAIDKKQLELLGAEREESQLSVRLKDKERVLEALTAEIKDRKAELESLNNKRRGLSKRIAEVEESLRELASTETTTSDALSETRREIGRVDAAMEVNLREQARLQAKCQAIKEIRSGSLERAVEEILNLRAKGMKGIYGTISELGNVDQKFSKALSAAAGRGLEFIVVENEDVAEECIVHLKQCKAGRATFLPLSKLKPLKLTDKEAVLARKCHGFAINLVSFEKRFKNAFAYVFRNTLVVDDIRVAKDLGIGEVRMVTLDGDLVEKSGAMSGGFFKPIGGFGEYDESKKMLEGINREVLRLEAKRNRLRGMEEDLKEKLKELNKKVLDLEREKGVSGDRISSLEKQVDDLVKIIAEMELRYKEERSSLKEARQLHRRAIARSKAARGELKELMAEKRAIEEQLESMGDEGLLSEVRVIEEKILELEKEKEAKLARIELNDSRIRDILRPKFDSLKDRIVELFNARKSIRREISRSTQEMKEVESRVEVQEKRVEEVAKGLEELRGRRDSLLKAVSAIERKRDDLKERHLRVRRTIEDSRVEIARLEAKLEDVLEALEEYADLNIELIAPMDTDELEREISRMEAEMRSLEPINMRAVEDYENVKEKYDALTNKINKLLEEKEAILRLMDEIERRKLNIFMEAFENIALNFRRIFEELSNGGEADMILDEENPLEGGLQIQARPVGKNLQHIELMSGGEKTLTAISFIFAIQRYQPAPFYILDEVDMFLDDENLRRVSELVKESSRGAQFIVVSLRDSLMASADQLFGVVNEDGISKIIGVELQEIGSSSG